MKRRRICSESGNFCFSVKVVLNIRKYVVFQSSADIRTRSHRLLWFAGSLVVNRVDAS